jgi:hypothetical protein
MLRARDVLLADALYCGYCQISTPQAVVGIDVHFEQHSSRITDFRPGY